MPKNPKLLYLASPYSNPNPRVCLRRFETASIVASRLFSKGYHVFSPICHSHPIAIVGGFKGGFEAWSAFDLRMLRLCDALVLAKLTGWQNSIGMKAEYQTALAVGKTIYECDVHAELVLVTESTTVLLSEKGGG